MKRANTCLNFTLGAVKRLQEGIVGYTREVGGAAASESEKGTGKDPAVPQFDPKGRWD